MNPPAIKQVERFKHLAVVLIQKTVRNVHAKNGSMPIRQASKAA